MRYVPLLLWSALIFYLSSRPAIPISSLENFNTLVFKTAHVVAYAILYIFAVVGIANKRRSAATTYLLAVIYTLLFAISDEIHQLFVPSRTGKISDVLIDIIGMTSAYYAIRILNIYKILIKHH